MSSTASKRLIAITGGGTSGHVVPALAIAESLIDIGYSLDQLFYFGCQRGVETQLVPPTGLRGEYLPVSGLQRSLNWQSFVRNIKLIPRLLVSIRRSAKWAKANKPQAVVAVGGYACLPLSLVAVMKGIPLVVVSYETQPGLATRLLARRAVATSVNSDEIDLPHKVITGAPVRRAIRTLDRHADRDAARLRLGVSADTWLIAAVGGSLGSHAINAAVVDMTTQLDRTEIDGTWSLDRRVAVRHIVGNRFIDKHVAPITSSVDYTYLGYENQMVDVLAGADVLIARAGASTLAEIVTVGIAAIIIPWPLATGDHQLHNAQKLARLGAVLMLEEQYLSGERLADLILDLLNNPAMRHQLEQRAFELGQTNRSKSLAHLISSVADSSSLALLGNA